MSCHSSSRVSWCSAALLAFALCALGCQLDRNASPSVGPGLEPPDPSAPDEHGDAGLPQDPDREDDEKGDFGDDGDLPDVVQPIAGTAGTGGAGNSAAGTNAQDDDPLSEPEDGGIPPSFTAGPLGPCARDVECGEGLVCVGDAPGFCGTPCESDADCERGDGLSWLCQDDGACHLPCTSQGNSVECPADLQCRRLSLLERECGYVLKPGARDRGALEPCDLTRGNTDCEGDLVCQRALDSDVAGPGFCTSRCGALGLSSSCEHATDATAAFECIDGACAFECTEGTCPSGMRCEPAGDHAFCHPAP